MIGFDGTTLDDALREYIDTYHIGGTILFARNITSPQQVTDLCGSLQEYGARCGRPPLFIAIDQEGGKVARLKPPFTQFPGNPAMECAADAEEFARITAMELNQIGVNMNMAPVLDVLPEDGPSVMRDRSFGSDPAWVAELGCAVIERLQSDRIMAVAKHFPGIGRTVLDSHNDLPDLDIDRAELAERDLLPFEAAIAADVSGIMLSHIRYTRQDPLWPASLSPTIADDLLRGRLGFDGLTMTDDLDMGAIAKHHGIANVVAQCLSASVDILLICHSGPAIRQAIEEIAAITGRSEEMAIKAEDSLRRIAALKEKYLR
jgi:beta-N-acetylhexosaminidase